MQNEIFVLGRAVKNIIRNGDVESAVDKIGYMLEDIEVEFDDRGHEFLLTLRDTIDDMLSA